jgi:hypothetical protein
MNRIILAVLATAVAVPSSAHDPRSSAREFSHALHVEGAGSVDLRYKSLHWNPAAYARLMSDAAIRDRVNAGVWNDIGSAELGFDLVIGDKALAKGSYRFGLNLDGEDAFSLILTSGEQRLVVPLDVAKSDATAYVSFTIVPTDAPDTFVLEGRGGEFVGRAKLTVPYLADHPEGEATH